MYKALKYKITGVAPLILHNGQLADPLNPITKALKKITGKRNKTEADYEEMAKLEWYGSWYMDKGIACIPGEVVEATFINGAKKKKMGPQAKAGMFCPDHAILHFNGQNGNGKTDLDALWASGKLRFSTKVTVSRQGVMRMRPRLEDWSAEFTLQIEDEMLNPSDAFDILDIAGQYVGFCDWRPRFGRFSLAQIS